MEVLNGKLATKYGILSTKDGIGHDTFMPSHLTLKAGVPVKMTVYNYDEGPHTFTVSNLNINEQIKPHVSDTQPDRWDAEAPAGRLGSRHLRVRRSGAGARGVCGCSIVGRPGSGSPAAAGPVGVAGHRAIRSPASAAAGSG
jgi:hypothetical protein